MGGHCLILWEKVQRHIEYGGLGIHNLELLGCALRILWLWAQKTEWDRPWAGLPISIPRKAQGLFDVAVDAIVGNGEHILFWTDRWLDGHTMAEIATNLIKTAGKRTAKPRTVAQATQNRRWVGDINGALTIEVLIEYLHIWDLVDGLLLQPDVQDRYTWKLSHDGIATAKLHIGPTLWEPSCSDPGAKDLENLGTLLESHALPSVQDTRQTAKNTRQTICRVPHSAKRRRQKE